MRKTTGAGTVYTSRNLTRHYAGAVAALVVGAALAAVVAVLLFPSLLDWVRS